MKSKPSGVQSNYFFLNFKNGAHISRAKSSIILTSQNNTLALYLTHLKRTLVEGEFCNSLCKRTTRFNFLFGYPCIKTSQTAIDHVKKPFKGAETVPNDVSPKFTQIKAKFIFLNCLYCKVWCYHQRRCCCKLVTA